MANTNNTPAAEPVGDFAKAAAEKAPETVEITVDTTKEKALHAANAGFKATKTLWDKIPTHPKLVSLGFIAGLLIGRLAAKKQPSVNPDEPIDSKWN